jgi:glutamyl-tRNA synthetase
MNYIALLGWSPGTNQELFSLEDLIKIFDYMQINKAPAIFDPVKLRWMNGEYIKRLSIEEFHQMALPYYAKEIKNPNIDTVKISELLHTRVEVLNEIPNYLDFFNELPEYSNELYIHKKMKTTFENSLVSLEKILPVLENLDNWTHEVLESAMLGTIQEMGIKNGLMLWPVRTALSGKASSPGGAYELADILGKEESLRRIRIGIEQLKKA